MPNSPLPVIHIGLQKTATTTLQEHFFARHPMIDYLGRPYPDEAIGTFVRELYVKDGVALTDSEMLASPAARAIRDRLRGDRVVALSEEFLSTDIFADRSVIAGRLKSLFGDAKIVITIRNQTAIAPSEYIDRSRSRPYVDFDRWVEGNLADYERQSLRIYDYARLADLYAALFGHDNVGIFLFEQFLQNREAFVTALCRFMAIPVGESARHLESAHENPTKSQRLLTYKKLRSVLGHRVQFSRRVPAPVNAAFQRFLSGGQKARVTSAPETARRLEARYRESNARLAREYALPLEIYGYPL